MSRRSALFVTLGLTAGAYGVAAELVADRHGRLTTYAGASGWAAAMELVAAALLVGAGLLTLSQRPAIPTGALAVAAGAAWLAPDLVGWEGGPGLVRSMGMLLAGLWLPLLLHAALAFPSRRLPSGAARALVVAVYAQAIVLNVGRALVRDPYTVVDCWDDCTANSFLVRSSPGLARELDWVDVRLTMLLAAAVVVLCALRLATASTPARRMLAPLLVSAGAASLAHAAHAGALLRSPLEVPDDSLFSAIFIAQGATLAAAALALVVEVARVRHAPRAVERLVVELAHAPAPGSLEDALAAATADPSLRVVYPLAELDRYVDSQGDAVPAPAGSALRMVTPIVREGRAVALVEHDRAALAESFRDDVGPAVRLAVDNERLHAEALARLAELRQSRARIVATSDLARRRLERDLHDGAQQRLVALSFGLRVAATRLGQVPDERLTGALVDAECALAKALAAVRVVANGLFPATLTSAGLAHAVGELAELAPLPLEIGAVPEHRLPPAVEAAAYGVIREVVENAALHARAGRVSLRAVLEQQLLVVEAADDGVGGANPARGNGLLDVADRVGALGGRVRIESPVGAGTRIRAEIPCG